MVLCKLLLLAREGQSGNGSSELNSRKEEKDMVERKHALALTATTAVLGAACMANADLHDPALDQTYTLGAFHLDSLANGGVTEASFTITPPENEFPIVGFSFAGTVDGVGDSGAWASDMRMTVDDPTGDSTSFGGFSTTSDYDWDFQGGGSTDDGDYDSGPHLIWSDSPISQDGENSFTFSFTNDWDSTLSPTHVWSDVQITFHKIPAPGALALLGLAGLVGTRRRRA